MRSNPRVRPDTVPSKKHLKNTPRVSADTRVGVHDPYYTWSFTRLRGAHHASRSWNGSPMEFDILEPSLYGAGWSLILWSPPYMVLDGALRALGMEPSIFSPPYLKVKHGRG